MDERELRESLRAAEVPGESGARARARRTTLAAYAARPIGTRRHVSPRFAVAASLVAVAAGLAAAVGPSATARWVGTTLNLKDELPAHRAPASLLDLPGGGRLLVSGGEGASIVGEGPSRRIEGASGRIGWSAFGRYVIHARGRQVQVLAVDGRVAWTQRYGRVVSFPTWSRDGNRIAFRVGQAMWVTGGDGTDSHPLRQRRARRALRSLPVSSSWRPGLRHELAVVESAQGITLIDADSGELRWRLRAPRDTFSLSWSDDGRRLLAVGPHSHRLYGADGQLLSERATPPGTRLVAGQLSPSGRQIALMRTRAGDSHGATHDVLLAPTLPGADNDRLLITGHELGDLRFSPTGRWLLVGWRRLDSWLFFATANGDRRMRVVSSVSRRVGQAEPVVEGWCCAQTRR